MADIKVTATSGTYPVIVGNDIGQRLAELTTRQVGGNRLFLIIDANVYALYGTHLHKLLRKNARTIESFVLPSGESQKSQRTVTALHDFLLGHRISRSDFILAAGGGVTTDIVGYVAATVLRGVCWGAVPTTLLGMVDAAIGGKTGINHAQGKNLIGAIWQPSFVICDQHYLHTLPVRHLVAGYGEILKYAGLVGEPMFRRVAQLLDGEVGFSDWTDIIRASARYKVEIVSEDEREEGIRAYLNLGHTFGHAIEKTTGYGRLLHGEAVIVGLLGAICLSMLVNPGKSPALKDYYRLALDSTELVPRRRLQAGEILKAMTLDKKRIDQSLRFVLLKKPGAPYLATGFSREMITFAVEQMIADYQAYGGKYAPRNGR